MKINYKDKKFISPEEIESQDIEFMVEAAKLQFQKDALETRKELKACQLQLKDLKTEYPLDVQAIIDKQVEIENLEDALGRMDILSEEFGFSS